MEEELVGLYSESENLHETLQKFHAIQHSRICPSATCQETCHQQGHCDPISSIGRLHRNDPRTFPLSRLFSHLEDLSVVCILHNRVAGMLG